MKRILIMLLTLVMCLGCFAACTTPGGTEDTTADNGGSDAATLADAVENRRWHHHSFPA